MDAYSTETVVTTVALAVFIIYGLFRIRQQNNNRRLPPGPTGLPILGYLPFLTKKPHVKLLELAKKYGPVFSLQLGRRRVIILGDFKSTKEAFAQDAFMGRPPDMIFDSNKESEEIRNSVKWRDQRRISLQILKDLGFGRSGMEEHMKEEILSVMERIVGLNGKPTVFRPLLTSSVSNNIAALVFGKRLHFDDEKRIMLDKVVQDIGNFAKQIGMLSFFPVVSKVLRFLGFGNYHKLQDANRTMKGHIRAEVKEHQKTLDQNSVRDFIDGYLHQIEKSKNNPNNTFIIPVLEDLVQGFFGAGSETVRVTLEWLLLTVAAFPDVQEKVHREIDDVIGRERFPTWADRTKMPFTEAVILEVMRWKTIVPINILRYTLQDTTLNSYFIPKDTYVIANLYAAQHDPALWNHPDSFRPERFISKDGKKTQKPECFIPFSIGKRSCPGELFAQIEIFVFFAALLQRFDVFLPEGAVPDFEGELGVSLQPKPQDLQLKVRQ